MEAAGAGAGDCGRTLLGAIDQMASISGNRTLSLLVAGVFPMALKAEEETYDQMNETDESGQS